MSLGADYSQISVWMSLQFDKQVKSAGVAKDCSWKNQEGETLQIITKDLIRNLR